MNDTIQSILSHRSIRSFSDKPISDSQIEYILKCAQSASTTSYMQPYTIIDIKDKTIKEQLAISTNNKQVAKNSHFLIFCMDLNRHKLAAEIEGFNAEAFKTFESTEWFLSGIIDTSIAAQNAVIAAESMGLGICYIGGVRRNLWDLDNILKTPTHVMPLFGLCIGFPEQKRGLKPRLPIENVYHKEYYPQDEEILKQKLRRFNKITEEYYDQRTNGQRKDRWSEQIISKLKRTDRLYIKKFFEEKKINDGN